MTALTSVPEVFNLSNGMVKRRATKGGGEKTGRGPRGRTGAVGPTGPAGPAGPNHSTEIAALNAQMAELIQQLQTQLVRIGQMQAQLDRLTSALASGRRDRRATDRVQRSE